MMEIASMILLFGFAGVIYFNLVCFLNYCQERPETNCTENVNPK